jgi:hypothetical protein
MQSVVCIDVTAARWNKPPPAQAHDMHTITTQTVLDSI